jgi:transcriptional regulator with XRE-family HTH domain
MEQLKDVFAGNLIQLRTKAGLTQAELAAKINYSDKSVSKWERAEALPDLLVTKELADIFGVSVDFMLTSHDAWEGKPAKLHYSTGMITAVVLLGILTLAIFIFVLLYWIVGKAIWMVFVAAAPVALITLLVLNSVWHKVEYHPTVVSLLILGLFAMVYYILHVYCNMPHPWELVFIWMPTQLLVLFSFNIRRKK